MEMRSTLIKKMKCIYIYLFLCGNKAKYETIKNAVLVAEDNEILREEFMKCNNNTNNLYFLILNSIVKSKKFVQNWKINNQLECY